MKTSSNCGKPRRSTRAGAARRRSPGACNAARDKVRTSSAPTEHAHVAVAILAMLPAKVRVRFCYVAMGAAWTAFGLGLYLAPQTAVASGAGVAIARAVVKALRKS